MTIPRVSLRQLATDTVQRATNSNDPLDEVTTIIRLREELVSLEQAGIRDLRGAGVSWDAIAARTGDLNATTLFTRTTGFTKSTWWTCTSCNNTVTDYGPLATRTDDAERGHGNNCPRHAREVTERQRDAAPGE